VELVKVEIELDESTVATFDDAARGSGRSREDIIAAAAQREAASRVLRELLQRVPRNELSSDEAVAEVYAERDAMRAEQHS
jgi:hypothetical protein